MPTMEPLQPGSRRPQVIDFHVHPSIALYKDMIAGIGTLTAEERFPHTNYFPPNPPDWVAEKALEVMEYENITAQILSLPDATIMLRGEFARRFARRVNEAMAEIVAKAPGRFGAFAVLPHDDAESTLAEIAYALDVLKLDGICTTSNIRGVYLGDASFDPWMEELNRRGATLFVHPAVEMPEVPKGPLYLELSFDSARMVRNMISSGAKRRFSDIKVIATHAGGPMPFLAHRYQMIESYISGGKLSEDDIKADLASFYYDLTTCMSESTLTSILHLARPSQLLMGFDYPYAPSSFIEPEIERFFAHRDLSSVEKIAVCSGNALRLIPRFAPSLKPQLV
jgi:predicted TIM-barrel fold metal-dependent hydrolase